MRNFYHVVTSLGDLNFVSLGEVRLRGTFNRPSSAALSAL